MRETILTCAQKETRVNLICRTEQKKKLKKWKREKLKGEKPGMPLCSGVFIARVGVTAIEISSLTVIIIRFNSDTRLVTLLYI